MRKLTEAGSWENRGEQNVWVSCGERPDQKRAIC